MTEPKTTTGKILIVDDELLVAGVLSAFLEEEGYEVSTALTGQEAMQRIQKHRYDVILTDLILPDLNKENHEGGLQILAFAKQVQPLTEVIIITGHSTLHIIKQAMRLGAYDLIVKPPMGAVVVQTVANALVKRQLTEERDQLAREMERVRADQQELFELATRDGLTNLFNFRYLKTQLQNMMAKTPLMAQNPRNARLSLLYIDTDNFKTYNDRFGHLEGDQVLREIAQVLTSNIRNTDIAARHGGDEFIIVLHETDKELALMLARRCVKLIAGHPFKEQVEKPLTVSVGVATYPHDALTAEEIINKADDAMYVAKQNGGNQVFDAADLKNS